MRYKIILSKAEIEVIYRISDLPEKQRKLMSVYTYVFKKYTDKETGELYKSINKLYKMYIRHHKYMSRSYFFKLVEELTEAFDKVKKDNIKDNKKDNANEAVHSENTSTDEEYREPNNKQATKTILNTPNNKTKFCATVGDKTLNVKELVSIAKDLFRTLRIRSKHVQTDVIDKLYQYSNKIFSKGASSYITSVILDKKHKREQERVNFNRNFKVYSTPLFIEPLTKADIDLEHALLGW